MLKLGKDKILLDKTAANDKKFVLIESILSGTPCQNIVVGNLGLLYVCYLQAANL